VLGAGTVKEVGIVVGQLQGHGDAALDEGPPPTEPRRGGPTP
jgi:hypothetical protein